MGWAPNLKAVCLRELNLYTGRPTLRMPREDRTARTDLCANDCQQTRAREQIPSQLLEGADPPHHNTLLLACHFEAHTQER